MKRYRVCSLDNEGRISQAYELLSHDDSEALAEGEKLAGTRPLEIWQEGRLIARLERAPAETEGRLCL